MSEIISAFAYREDGFSLSEVDMEILVFYGMTINGWFFVSIVEEGSEKEEDTKQLAIPSYGDMSILVEPWDKAFKHSALATIRYTIHRLAEGKGYDLEKKKNS